MNHEEDGVMGFMVEFTDDEIRTLLHAVSEAIRLWPGYPARPIDEQEKLQSLRSTLFSMTLDMAWEHSEDDSPSEAEKIAALEA